MNKHLFTTLALCAFGIIAHAQEVEFTADRPGASTGTGIVGKNVIQLEQGIEYEGDGGKGTFTFSNTLFRYGLFENAELRLGGDGFLFDNGDKMKPAFSGISIGTKISCFQGNGAIPAVAVLADFAIPNTASNGFSCENLAPSLYLLFDNPINDTFSLGYNIGAEWDGDTPKPVGFLALCLGVNFTERLGGFIESYNYLSCGNNSYCADLGFNWMAGKKVQLDLAANIDLCNPSKYWAISFGVAWQINK